MKYIMEVKNKTYEVRKVSQKEFENLTKADNNWKGWIKVTKTDYKHYIMKKL